MDVQSLTPLLAIAIPLGGAVLIAVTGKHANVRDAVSIVGAVLQFGVVASMLGGVRAGDTLHYTLLSFIPEVAIALRVDALGILFAAVASFLWIPTVVYAIGYMRALQEHDQTRFYVFLSLSLAATLGIAFAANLVTLYLFYEVLTLTTYPLVTHAQTPEASKGGHRYLFYQFGTGIAFLLPAILLTFTHSGTFDFRPGGVFPAGSGSGILLVVYLLFLFGIAKAAIMPFHAWLPAAMVAPTPVSAVLHAVAVVNAGVFTLLRVMLDVFGEGWMRALDLGAITLVVASFTILMASAYALRLDNLKLLLAYSTIGQLSYMVLGAALLSPAGMAGGIIHLVNHSVSKITLFFCAGAIYVSARKTLISELSGIGKMMPVTLGAFTIGALSIVGLPPTAGFVTKWHLVVGALEVDQILVLLVVAVSTFMSAAYYLPIVGRAFFRQPAESDLQSNAGVPSPAAGQTGEGSALILGPLLVTAILTVLLGLYPQPVLDLVRQAMSRP